ncbi:MAG: aldolase catalytic domain-containing protein [Lachnospiraceae bacterium]|nr:aldolase catalytic domain-containing protein [Lachnospiraceae bacterium]
MATKNGDLVSFRPDIKVLDATLRDGGLVNNFQFSDDFVRALYQANILAGVDYMEFGYKADRDIFNESDFGKWKFCKDEDIRKITQGIDTDMKIAVMADVGRTNFRRDILPKEESPIDMIRVATYINSIPAAIEMIEDAKRKGYETTVNIMAVSKVNLDELKDGLRHLAASSVDVIYLVDSFGVFYPEQIVRLSDMYLEVAAAFNKQIGIHAHNNQQLAFANTIQALTIGVSYLDATVNGMGRGAGNCYLENLLGFLRNPKYRLTPIMKFVQDYMLKLKQDGLIWGPDIPYLLTGILNTHPSSAIKFLKDGRTDYTAFEQELLDNAL